jgi:hypothetical protein
MLQDEYMEYEGGIGMPEKNKKDDNWEKMKENLKDQQKRWQEQMKNLKSPSFKMPTMNFKLPSFEMPKVGIEKKKTIHDVQYEEMQKQTALLEDILSLLQVQNKFLKHVYETTYAEKEGEGQERGEE